MDSKKLNWENKDDFFSQKTNVFEKLFEESPSPQKSPKQIITQEDNLDLFDFDNEYYNALKDSIVLSKGESNNTPRLISVTSSDFGEGVSSISSKLAITFAKSTNGPVLLVDSNFAKPSIHHTFSLNLSPGLGEVLIENHDSTSVIQQSPIHNLFVLTAGDIDTNPTYKYDSPLFHNLLAYWRDNFNFVIFDTPPLQCDMKQCDMNSSIRLSTHMDGVIIIIEAERIRREISMRLIERLKESNSNILGVVLNKTKFYIPKFIYKRL
jgi:capsular exopolysaccharide synthesis family protein